MRNKSRSKLTQSVHEGSSGDPMHKGMVTPIYPATAYDYDDQSDTLYQRYFNTPNQKAVVEKLSALENAETGLIFSSGMAAILTALFSFLKKGDHAIFQNDLYGGTHHAVVHELTKFGVEFTFVNGAVPAEFEKAIRPTTRVMYIETPSNPTLKITNIRAVAKLGRKHGIVTLIDNTFASPVNQNPLDLGMDIVLHSGTKYIGGHSDISCGAALGSKELIGRIYESALHYGGNLDAHTCWLVERSLKTIVLRVRQQNKNAMAIAEHLNNSPAIAKVYYPGLRDHPDHDLAKEQMLEGFGGMLSFEVKGDPDVFISKLSLIKRAVSLGGVESTISSPVKTSHVKMTAAERAAIGVTSNLLRLSVGIEETQDLLDDLQQALE